MLVKAELSQIAVLDYPKLSKDDKKHYQYCGAAQIVSLPRCGEVLVVDIFSIEKRALSVRFFSDGKTALTCAEWPVKLWTKRLPSSHMSSSHSVTSSEEMAKLAHEFLSRHQGRLHTHSLGDTINQFGSNIYAEKQDDGVIQLTLFGEGF